MSETNQLIDKLEQGVDTLLEKVSKLSVVIKNQKDKIEDLVQVSENYKNENKTLSNRVDDLKLKIQDKKIDSEKTGQYKTRIKELVREIDSCISLLNNG